MRVYVIMENDLPACVYKHERDAVEFLRKKIRQQKPEQFRRVYWSVHVFDLIEETKDA